MGAESKIGEVMKRIEKPDKETQRGGGPYYPNWFDPWFDEHIEPLNKLIDKDIAVTGFMEHRGNWVWSEEPSEADTHKAYLIGIEPIEADSAEKVLRDLIDGEVACNVDSNLVDRAKAILKAGQDE